MCDWVQTQTATTDIDMVEKEEQQPELDRNLFLSQNAITGEVMPNRWTLRQLCRILCPPTTSETETHPPTTIVSSESQLLAIEPDGSYAKEGWKPAKCFPVLKEALSMWYYQQTTTSTTTTSTNGTNNGDVQGPVSCRSIANLLESNQINKDTLVYSEAISAWDKVPPNLLLAIDAFQNPARPTNSAPEQPATTDLGEVAFPGDDELPSGSTTMTATATKDKVQDELEAFLASTEGATDNDSETAEEAYESDGGTRYLKDARTGKWVHEGLVVSAKAAKPPQATSANKPGLQDTRTGKQATTSGTTASRKRKRTKFAAKNAKCWVYVTGLPTDCTTEELQQVFSKAGIIDLDPETQLPKIKLYRHRDGPNKGQGKGDASICYARPESVELAITVLDETPLRMTSANGGGGADDAAKMMKVERAKFEQHGDSFDTSKGASRISNAKRQVAKMAAVQAMDWDEGEFNGRISGGRKGLRIIVLKHLFDPPVTDDALRQLEQDLRKECTEFGTVEKITVFASNPEGVVVVKFSKPGAASEAVKFWNGKQEWKGRQTKDNNNNGTTTGKIMASFWDGVTDFTVRNEEQEKEEMEQRHEEFGQWLDEQQEELPEELRLKTANE